MTAEQLEALPAASKVYDRDGNPWTKDLDGYWCFDEGLAISRVLIEDHAPIGYAS